MKTHYDPYGDTLMLETYPCGSPIGGKSYNATDEWGEVTCKRCLRNREKLTARFTADDKRSLGSYCFLKNTKNKKEEK